jgi:hypothetical protein
MPAVHLSGEYNITYVQIPKTAGTSVGLWLKDHKGTSTYTEWYDHPVKNDINKKLGKNFSFSIVRNPWSRMISLYFFLKNWTSPNPDISTEDSEDSRKILYYINEYDDGQFPPFDKWIKNSKQFKTLPWIWWEVNTPQTAWTNDVDLVIKYENLQDELRTIQDMFHCYDPLPIKTVTKGIYWNSYQELYTSETEQIVANLFEEEIDLWKYTF